MPAMCRLAKTGRGWGGALVSRSVAGRLVRTRSREPLSSLWKEGHSRKGEAAVSPRGGCQWQKLPMQHASLPGRGARELSSSCLPGLRVEPPRAGAGASPGAVPFSSHRGKQSPPGSQQWAQGSAWQAQGRGHANSCEEGRSRSPRGLPEACMTEPLLGKCFLSERHSTGREQGKRGCG